VTGPEQHAATVEIPISGGAVTLIDAADLPLVEGIRLHVDRSDNGYAYFTLRRPGEKPKSQSLARFLMDAPPGMEVDHINGNRLDNRRDNLRVVTPAVNQRNRHRLNKNNTSGYRGVARSTHGTWRAEIRVDRRKIHLGYFDSREEAFAARVQAEARYFGEVA